MDLRSLFIFITGLITRLAFLHRHTDRRDIFELASVLIAFQDGRISNKDTERALEPFADDLPDFLRHLAKGRETTISPRQGSIRLPLGCRLGLLHFSPLLQLAQALWASQPGLQGGPIDAYKFDPLPATRETILAHLERSCGWTDQIDDAVRRRFGHTLNEYAAYLVRLRKKDPALFVLLIAREFPLAASYLERRDCLVDSQWLTRATALAEVQRLAEMMSFCRDRKPVMSSRVRKALTALASRKRPSQRRRAVKDFRDCLPVIRRLEASVEGIRTLFLGDATSPGLVDAPNGMTVDWNSISSDVKRTGASRCELFAKRRGRHVGARRHVLMHMYHGIPLDQLAVVALTDLTAETGKSEGSDDCTLIAACMCFELIGITSTFGRSGRRAAMIEEIYLRRFGKLGCGGRFDRRLQLNPIMDEPLYWVMNATAMGGSASSDRSSVRSLIDVGASLLTRALVVNCGPIDPRLAAQLMAYVASSLTPPTMDPIFASLIDRCLTERAVPANQRTNPWNNPPAKQQLMQALRQVFREVRGRFARFEDLHDRPNHPDANSAQPLYPHHPLTVQPTAPRVRPSKLHPQGSAVHR